MRASGLASFPTLGTAASALLLVFGALVWNARYSTGGEDGQVWRRGFLGGEQVVLRDGGSYAIQRWSSIGSNETVENGVWKQLGDTVSLVPSTPGHTSRIVRRLSENGNQYLYDPVPGAGRPSRDQWFERVD